MGELFRAFPQFIAMYETLYSMDKDMVRAMGFFSKELRIMDENTVRYMIDEMEGSIDRLQGEKDELENRKSQLESQNSELEGKNSELESQKSQLEAENDRLRAELQKYQGMQQ